MHDVRTSRRGNTELPLKVAIEGRLHYSSWEDRNTGQRRSKIDVTVDEIEFMSSRGDNGSQSGYGGNRGGGYGVGQNNYGGGQGGNYGGSYGGNQGGSQGGYNGGNQGNYDGQDAGNQGGYQNGAGATYGGGQGNYDAPAQRSQEPNMPEAPAPSAYDDEDIPF